MIEISDCIEESVDVDVVGDMKFSTAEEAGLIMPPPSPC